MEYFVPAWHEQYDDWSISIPNIASFDAVSQMRILQNNNHKIGLIISDYQPQLMTRLNQLSYYPDKLFSVYDYLQGIDTLESRVIELNDFNWPANASLDFTPFRTLIVDQNKLIARVLYDLEGKVLRVEYKSNKEDENYTLLMDSRGFVSSKITKNEVIYLDPYGNWRFKQNRTSGAVTVNSDFNFCQKKNYSNIRELINETVRKYFITNLTQQDHLIVTVDDQTTLSTDVFKNFRTIYLINQRKSYQKSLASLNHEKLLVNKDDFAAKIDKDYPNQFDIHVVPTYNSEFRLGHSSRQKVQEITFFAENAENNDIAKIIKHLCEYVSKDAENKSIRVLTYSLDKDNWVNQVIEQIKKENKGKWLIGSDQQNAENSEIGGLKKVKKIPRIDLKKMRLTNISQLLKSLDKTRVLINWGSGNELMQTAAISIGIPQIQNFLSSTVIHQKNGYICQKSTEISDVLDSYLNDLKVWNNAIVYNVKMLNRYSEENIMKRWEKLLGDK